MWLPMLLLGLFQPLLGYQIDMEKLKNMGKGRVESCGGWQLNRLPEVKAFINEDLPLYHNLEMKHVPGADPELLLLSSENEEIDRIRLSNMRRKEINQLAKDLGFYRKESPDSPVPPEFQKAPRKQNTLDEEGKTGTEDTKEEL